MSHLLDLPLPYRLWQAPFADAKIAPVLADHDFRAAQSVLDVGCGPGTNSSHAGAPRYIGTDLNVSYLKAARGSMPRLYFAADARLLPVRRKAFDAVLVNSLTHHLDDEGLQRLLGDLRHVLRPDGTAHIVDMVKPTRRGSIAFALAHFDRGDHVRAERPWLQTLESYFEPVSLARYSLQWLGIPLWHMIYFKGRPVQ